MGKNVVVVGGGIIGLSTAYYLQKSGHKVTVIDKSDISSGASFVNAGYITPSHIISLAAPGMINKGIKWMFNAESPFYVKPRLDLDFIKWSWAFKKASTYKKVEEAVKPILDINLLSRDLYEDIKTSNDFNFHYQRKGLLMCYQTDKVGEAEWGVGKRAIEEGLTVKNLSKDEVKQLEPNVDYNIKGAVYFDSDAHMTPSNFMPQMLQYLKSNGVDFITNEEVRSFEVTNNKITSVITNTQSIKADEFVIATGSWSQELSKQLKLNIPIQAGKGYCINSQQKINMTIPAILCEAKVAVTPMDGFTRFAGTMEVGGINHTINPRRVNAIAKAAGNYYSGLTIPANEKENAACGLRPCSPDGLPFIGKLSTLTNTTIATGHAMMGWSLGPATGKLVAQLISEEKTSININTFNAERYC